MDGNNLTLPSGIGINGKKFMLRFSHNGCRLRVTTIFAITRQNLVKVTKILATIKLDLERNQFFLANYKHVLLNIDKLNIFDAHYQQNKNKVFLNTMLAEQDERYKTAYKNGKLAYASYLGYHGIIFNRLMPYFENMLVSDIKVEKIEDFILNIKLSKKRISSILSPLRPIFSRAKKYGLIKTNPLDELEQSEINLYTTSSDYVIEPFNTDEKNIIINATHGQLRNFIQFAFWTGMRVSEIFALTWKDIDFNSETISVNKSKTIGGMIKTTKTKAGIRTIELTPLALVAIKEQQQYTNKDNPDATVFHNPTTNKPWSKPDAFRRYWIKVLNNANVKYRNPHQMRHTFISYMLMKGNRPEILYKMVGHVNTEMIYRIYGKFIQGETKGKQLIV